MSFRPWGELEWLLKKIALPKYDLMGCLGTEDRSIAALNILNNGDYINYVNLLEILDPVDSEMHRQLRDVNKKKISSITSDIITLNLLSPIGQVKSLLDDFINKSSGCVILDISVFPKRFFFPLFKFLFRAEKITTLIVTSSTPLKYKDGNLSSNPSAWQSLPTFSNDDPDESVNLAIVGVGFMPFSLPQLLRDRYSRSNIKFLFPFPPGPPTYQRTWEFLNNINETSYIDMSQVYRVDSSDVSETFNKICSFDAYRNEPILFAPYGPKSISLAMCIYATLANSYVFYTQPNNYEAKYSEGFSKCYGYLIKLNGESFYKLPERE